MDNARRFLEHQIASYEQQLRAAEKRRADFRARYIDILPNAGQPGRPRAGGGAQQRDAALDGRLQDVIMARDALKQEVDNTPPMLVAECRRQQRGPGRRPRGAKTPLQGGGGAAPDAAAEGHRKPSRRDRAAQADRVPEDAAAPDAMPRLPATPAPAGADARPATLKRSVPNPVYDQLKVKLIDADTQVASLQRQRDAGGGVSRQAGEDPARAAGADRRIREHGPRLHRAARRLRGTAGPPAVGQHRPGGRYPGGQGEAADRRSAGSAAPAGGAEPACCW